MKNSIVYDMITNSIIEKLENNIIPWQKPWNVYGMPKNYISKKEYHGINVLMLSMQDFSCPYFITFNQCKKLKGSINKGSKSIPIVKVMQTTIADKTETDNNGDPVKKNITLLRYYRVFNLEQTTLIDSWTPENKTEFKPVENAEKIINNYRSCPNIVYDGNKAFYSPKKDYIGMPVKESFKNTDGYYSTMFHEIVHSTGHVKRLNRTDFTGGFGSSEYSKEELTAELGASFLCALSGIKKTIDNSASYIASWLKVLKNDNRMIMSASSKAQKATDYVIS